jgi:hypothetical protein
MKKLTLDTLRKKIIEGSVELQNDLAGSGLGYLYATVRNNTTKVTTTYEISIHHGVSIQNSNFFNL